MKPEETLDFHLKSAWQSLSRMYNELALSYGGTMATGYVLLSIDKAPLPLHLDRRWVWKPPA